MKKIISEINTLGKLHQSLISPQNVSKIVSKLSSDCTFIDLQAECSVHNVTNRKGLYVFYAKFPFNNHQQLLEFGKKWGVLRDKKAPDNCPRFHKTNAKCSQNLKLLKENRLLPFYLGKSEKIKDRVFCHIDTPLDKTVYALKLKARVDLLKSLIFNLGFVQFDINESSYFCIELLEKKVRETIRPIVGKQ